MVNGIAAVYNQEDRPLLLSTNANTVTMSPYSGKTSERVRITSVSAPTSLFPSTPGSLYGTFNPPGNIAAPNITRVSISHNPDNPVTRPLSLLHLGYNTTNYVTTDGWRPWMDVGMFVSNKSDHVYLGLKNESSVPTVDKQDAVLGWGDNPNNTGGNGPDNLRFIFTSTTSNTQSPASSANSSNGLEVSRMEPTAPSTQPSNYGMVGIGNFSPTSGLNVDAKLDVNGDMRIRSVTPANTLTKILVIDPNDKNRVHYIDKSTLIGTAPGGYCSSTPSLLAGHFGVPLGGYNYYFPGQGGIQNSVGIGQLCGAILRDAKLEVLNQHKLAAGSFRTNFPQGNIPAVASATALMAHSFGYVTNNFMMVGRGLEASAMSVGGSYNNTGVFTTAQNGMTNYGIWASTQNPSSVDRAGYFQGLIQTTASYIQTSDSLFKTDVEDISNAISIIKRLNPKTYFMDSVSFPKMNFDIKKQFGFIAQEVEDVIPNIVYKSYHPGIRDSIGNFIEEPIEFKSLNYNAIIPINTQAIKELYLKVEKQTLSDQSIKSNVQDLTGSLNKVLAMRGVSFNWNQTLQPQFQLDNSNHVGFIAQEINAVDPRLTFMGDENLMHVDYDKIVPIAVEAIQELNSQIAQRDSVINSLNDRLSHLESCLSGILPFLCQISHNSIQTTQQEFQQQLKKEIDVQLSNKGTIILNQNVPNPFAEQTQISFSIPESVKKAQIHFYDANGKLINSVEVQERGLGQINVFANDLSTGMYTYTLVADGQIVATKKMMKQ